MAVRKSRKHIKKQCIYSGAVKRDGKFQIRCVKEVLFVNRRYKKKRYLSVKNGIYNRARN